MAMIGSILQLKGRDHPFWKSFCRLPRLIVVPNPPDARQGGAALWVLANKCCGWVAHRVRYSATPDRMRLRSSLSTFLVIGAPSLMFIGVISDDVSMDLRVTIALKRRLCTRIFRCRRAGVTLLAQYGVVIEANEIWTGQVCNRS